MGYSGIFWIDEKPIRSYLMENAMDDKFFKELGFKVLSISTPGARLSQLMGKLSAQDFFDKGPAIHPCCFLLSDETRVLLWTGQRLKVLPEMSSENYDFICRLQHDSPPRHMVTSIRTEKDIIAAVEGGNNMPLENAGEFSIYSIFEDFTVQHAKGPEEEWPCKELGIAISELMFNSSKRSALVLNHGNAVHRACTFLKTEMCFFVWASNCLRPLGDMKGKKLN